MPALFAGLGALGTPPTFAALSWGVPLMIFFGGRDCLQSRVTIFDCFTGPSANHSTPSMTMVPMPAAAAAGW